MESAMLPLAEFRAKGYLQEANRCFFHPLGLELVIGINRETGHEYIEGIMDYRETPDGVFYKTESLDTAEFREKAKFVAEEALKRRSFRIEKTGQMIQPIVENPMVSAD